MISQTCQKSRADFKNGVNYVPVFKIRSTFTLVDSFSGTGELLSALVSIVFCFFRGEKFTIDIVKLSI